MNIEEILDVMDELLDRSWNLPLTGGRCVIDADKVRDMIDEVRLNLPGEIKQAKGIVADRGEIIAVAKREAELLVQKAEEHAKSLIAKEEIVRQSQQRAAEIMQQAQMKAREIRAASQDYSENILRQTEESLTRSLADVKGTRQALRSTARGGAAATAAPAAKQAQAPQAGPIVRTQTGAARNMQRPQQRGR